MMLASALRPLANALKWRRQPRRLNRQRLLRLVSEAGRRRELPKARLRLPR